MKRRRLAPLAVCAAVLALCIVDGGCKRTGTSSSVVTRSVMQSYLTSEGTLRETLEVHHRSIGDGRGRSLKTEVQPDGTWTFRLDQFGMYAADNKEPETKAGKLSKDVLLRLAKCLEENDFVNLRNIGNTSTNFLDPQDIKIQFGKHVVHYHAPNDEPDAIRAMASRYWSINDTVEKLIRESEEKKDH